MQNLSPYSKFKTPATLLGVMLLTSGLSCAVAPEQTAEPVIEAAPVAVDTTSDAIREAYASYQRRDFAGAAGAYSAVLDDEGAGTADQALANLGKALIHLSTDPEWRDLDQAGNSLAAAEALGESDEVGAGMLMNALSSLIGVEKNISELNSKLSNSSAEITALKGDLEDAKSEQAALNEALEKLKAITIGN